MDFMNITINKRGIEDCGSFSFPVRFGTYHKVESRDFVLHFTPSWRLIYAQSKERWWPDPNEWIKIGLSGIPVYYSSLFYGDVASLFGQHYIPIPRNLSFELFNENPFLDLKLIVFLKKLEKLDELFGNNSEFIEIKNGLLRWKRFYDLELLNILKARVTILPPDSFICDYQVFPVIISTGCTKNCGFCEVKDGTEFALRSDEEIKKQVLQLRGVLEKELDQFRGIFLGTLDALKAPEDKIFYSIRLGKKLLPHIKNFFLFGSPEALLEKDITFFRTLNKLKVNIYINIGLESMDEKTLYLIKKPFLKNRLKEIWEYCTNINKNFDRIEISLNILMNRNFPISHLETLLCFLKNEGSFPKGPIFLSPFREPIDKNFFETAKVIKRATKRPVKPYTLVPL